MSIEFGRLTNQETSSLLDRLESDINFDVIKITLVEENYVKNLDYIVKNAEKMVFKDGYFTTITLSFDEGNTTITIIDIRNVLDYNIHFLFDKNGEKYIKYMHVENGNFGEHVDIKHSTYLKNLELQEEKMKEIIDSEDSEVTANMYLPLYGNWCGPGHSGPGSPVDGIDRCCQSHDRCYGNWGYNNCACDKRLIYCLRPYSSRWFAKLAIYYFSISDCRG